MTAYSHRDDVLSEGTCGSLDELDKQLARDMDITAPGWRGPDGNSSQGGYFQRANQWDKDGFAWIGGGEHVR